MRDGALKAQLLTWGTSAEGDECKESDFLMNEKGPGDFGAGGIESVLGSPGGLVGVIVPGDPNLPWVPGHPRDPDCRNNPKICNGHTQTSLRNGRRHLITVISLCRNIIIMPGPPQDAAC